MKKIMFFRPLYSLGGTEIAMLNLIRNLNNFDIYVGYCNTSSDQHLLDRFSKYATIVNLNEVKDLEIDVFIPCSAHYNLEKSINNLKIHKTILWIHHLVNIETTILAEEDNDLAHIVAVSQTTADTLKELFPKIAHKIDTIYNIIDKYEIEESTKIPIKLQLAKDLNLVTVSRVCKEKGFDRMIHLVKALKEKKVDFKWFIAGGNYYKDEYKRIRELYKEFDDCMEWFGFIDNPHNIVKQCDYSVLLSDEETWGLVLTEAMILGIPCISSDFKVAYEQIQDGKNGIILNKDNTDSYIDRIDDIINNKEKYKKAVSNFSYENKDIIEKWNKLLNEI